MNNLAEYPLYDLLKILEESKIKLILSSFTCLKNKDVQDFLKNDSVENEKIAKSRTYVFIEEGTLNTVGYYTLANKVFEIDSNISGNKKNKIRGQVFGTNDNHIPSILIGQLGKKDELKSKRGFLLTSALSKILEIHELLGVRLVYLECENNSRLIKYYESFNFVTYVDKDGDLIKNEGGLIKMYLFTKNIKLENE